ncbi:MAG: sigma factor-like helix-turn-helix DNA-binding protein [Phycisphaeraceae bacterium]
MAESQANRVRQFVQGLDRDDRYIVLLYYADGLTPMEISRVLDLPSTRVRSRLCELRSRLVGLTQPRAATPAFGHDGLGDAPAAYA